MLSISETLFELHLFISVYLEIWTPSNTVSNLSDFCLNVSVLQFDALLGGFGINGFRLVLLGLYFSHLEGTFLDI